MNNRTSVPSMGTLLLSAMLSPLAVATTPTFVILTPANPPYFEMRVIDVSGDGRWVTGHMGNNPTFRAVRWAADGSERIELGLPAGKLHAEGQALSYDGSAIACNGYNSALTSQAFRWTAAGGGTRELIPLLPGGAFTYASGMSDDGTVITGWGSINASGSSQRMWRWSAASGAMTVTTLSPTSLQAVRTVSADGRWVLGGNGRWDSVSGTATTFPQVQPLASFYPTSISGDGSVVCGYSSNYLLPDSSYAEVGVRWTSTTGYEILATPAFSRNVLTPWISADGETILGTYDGYPFIWTRAGGPQDFVAYLAQRGVNTQGMTGLTFAGLSADGRVIAGMGYTAANEFRGWVMTDAPPACLADFDGSGTLTADDLGDYITCYFSTPACARAEFNGDGDLNADDLGDFITAYFSGC